MVLRAPLSLQHQFFCAMDKGDAQGVFGPQHTNTNAWRLRGELDVDVMRQALADVVHRHGMLRTALVRGEPGSYDVRPAVPVRLIVRQLDAADAAARDVQAEELVCEVEAGTYPVSELPHLRAFLGRFDDRDAVLVLTNHHFASDAWSMQLIIRDVATCYAARRRGQAPVLPEVPQYWEYAAWQADRTPEEFAAQRRYWRDKLAGARMSGIRPGLRPTDDVLDSYSTLRFGVDRTVTANTLKLAKATRSSPFMVMLSACNVLMRQLAGRADVVVPTFTSGRDEDKFQDTVGTFINFLPLSTNLSGCQDFCDVIARTRTSCADGYTNDIPFAYIEEEAPDLMTDAMEQDLDVIAFEVLQYAIGVDGDLVNDLEYTEIRKRVLQQPASSALPGGILWGYDFLPDGEMAGSLRFDRNRFDAGSMRDMTEEFHRLLRRATTAPDTPLARL
jgi:condensation enzyme